MIYNSQDIHAALICEEIYMKSYVKRDLHCRCRMMQPTTAKSWMHHHRWQPLYVCPCMPFGDLAWLLRRIGKGTLVSKETHCRTGMR
jgi:hypothetical protein